MARTSFKRPTSVAQPAATAPAPVTQAAATPKFIQEQQAAEIPAPQPTPAPTPATRPAPVPQPQKPIVVHQPKPTAIVPATEENEVEGEISAADFVMPYLSQGQKVGKLGDEFGYGVWILNGETNITAPLDDKTWSSVFLSVLRISKLYQEVITPYDPDNRGRTFNTMEEVTAAGLHCDWGANKQKPPCLPIAKALVVIEKPEGLEGVEEVFPFEINGKFFAPAIWTMASSAYGIAAKKVFTAAQFSLKGKLKSGRWELTTAAQPSDMGVYYVPVFERAGSYGPEEVEFFRSILG